MWFKKDPDAWLHDMIAADARRKGDDDVTVRQKVEAVRAEMSERRAASQAYYDHVAAEARAAGDDFITVEWKLDVARAKRHLDRRLDSQHELRRDKAEQFPDFDPTADARMMIELDYRQEVKKAGVRWFIWIVVFRLVAALTLGVFAMLVIADAVGWAGITEQRSFALLPLLVPVAFLVMPIERYATHAWRWFAEVVALDRPEEIIGIAVVAGIGAAFIFPGHPGWLQAMGWVALALGCAFTSMTAKGLSDIGWEGVQNFAKSLPSGAALFLITIIVVALTSRGYQQFSYGSVVKTPDQEIVRFAYCIGGPVLATWWLWIKWRVAPASRPRNLSISRLVGGAAEAAARGKVLVVGLWFAALGFVLLWICGPPLITLLSPPAAAPIVWLLPAIGTAVGAYLFLARGLGPIWNALSWSPLRGDTHGDSRTATERELRQAGLIPRNGNIYLGELLESSQPRPQVGYPGPAHILTIGPARCGKGVGLIVPNLVDLKRSILMVDPKGEAAAITARHRATLGRVVVLNPFDLFVDERPWLKSEGFNPLICLDPASKYFVDDATGIGEALVRVEGRDPHWSASAQELVTALVMFECLKGRTEGRTPSLANVRAMLPDSYGTSEGMPTGMALTVFEMIQTGFQPLVQKATRFKEQSREIQGIISAAVTQTKFIDSPPIAEDLTRGSFDFADMKREIVTVYLIPPVQHMSKHSNWLRLIVQSALQALQSAPSRNLSPPLFIMDEFAQLGHLQSIQDALGVLAGFGVQLWPILQDLNQLHTHYKDAWQSFIGQVGALTAFAPKDMFTAEHLAKLCGQKTEIIQTENERADQAGHGRSWGPQGLPLFRPEDLMRMPRGQMLCRVEGVTYPFFTMAPPYWTIPAFNPPTLDENPYAPKSR